MEYALLGFYHILQHLINLLLDFEITEGVTYGGIVIACMILGMILDNFKMRDSDSKSSGSGKSEKSKGGDKG